MSRYTGWHPRRGDVNPPSGLVDLGKKLLGELANRIRLGGPPTLVIRRETPEGFVEARMIYGKPHLFIQARRRHGLQIVDGFFARPTTVEQEVDGDTWYGTWWSENGDPHHIPMLALKPQKADAEALSSFWFNPALLPEGAQARYYETWFGQPDGLQRTANMDWTGDKGVLHFFGPLNRYNDPATYFDQLIYHNGALLVDVYDIVGNSWRVLGAALHGDLDLRVVLCFGFGNDLQVYRIPLTSASPGYEGVPLHLHPRLAVTYDGEDAIIAEKLGEFSFDEADIGYRHPMHFNQRGDECRAINWRESGLAEVPYEVVIAFQGGGCSITFSDVTITPATVTASLDETGSVSLATGVLRASEDGGVTSLVFPARTEINGGAVPSVPAQMIYTKDMEVSAWTRIAVDYRDNVPVYLEAKPKHGNRSVTVDFSRTVNASDDTGYLVWDNLTNTWGCPVIEGCDANISTTTAVEETTEYTTSFRADWFQLDAVSTVELTTGEAYTIDVIADGQAQGFADIDRTTTTERRTVDTDHWLLHVDLRHKVLCYQERVITEEYSAVEVQDSYYAPIGATGGTTTNATTQVDTQRRVVLRVAQENVETDLIVDSTTTDNAVDEFTPVEFGVETSAYTLLLVTPPAPGDGDVSEPLEPPQLSFENLTRHHDFGIFSPHGMIGAWAVSGGVLGYSYSIQPGDGEILPADQVPQRHGFCSLTGIRAALSWPALTNAADPTVFRRYGPISAISPFVVR